MRQRRAKNLKARLCERAEYLAAVPAEGKPKRYFDNDHPLFAEIGCGKGQFIVRKAQENPDANFLAIEGNETVILRALERAGTCEERLDNLKFLIAFAGDMSELFDEGQLFGIYLNFSDPWPKARHAKRRLTHRDRLRDYARVLKKGGLIEFKTDNDALYDFTLRELEAANLKILEKSRDLHGECCGSNLMTTEYEDKFVSMGKNINYVRMTTPCTCDQR